MRGYRSERNLVLGFEQDLRKAFLAVVEPFVHLRSLVETHAMGDEEARVGPALDYHIAQLAVVPLYVTLTSTKSLALLEELPEVDS